MFRSKLQTVRAFITMIGLLALGIAAGAPDGWPIG